MDRMEVIEENEEWTPIPETDEYEVTRSGHIRNAKTKKELHGTIDSQGRVKVYLTIHGKSCCKILSRIIAETYFGKEACYGKDVYHKNGNKLKNEVKSSDYVNINNESNQGLMISIDTCASDDNSKSALHHNMYYTAEILSDTWTKLSKTIYITEDWFTEGTGEISTDTLFVLKIYDHSLWSI